MLIRHFGILRAKLILGDSQFPLDPRFGIEIIDDQPQQRAGALKVRFGIAPDAHRRFWAAWSELFGDGNELAHAGEPSCQHVPGADACHPGDSGKKVTSSRRTTEDRQKTSAEPDRRESASSGPSMISVAIVGKTDMPSVREIHIPNCVQLHCLGQWSIEEDEPCDLFDLTARRSPEYAYRLCVIDEY